MTLQQQLKSIQEKRQGWLKSSQENGFEEGIFKLLTDLYPDKAHFIYELIQNAEDAGRRAGISENTITFDLRPDKLIFTHQGQSFDAEDIESITGIANSTKKEDMVQIGTFGIGFKSVFGYTDTPIIQDRKIAFSIENLVVPVPCTLPPTEKMNGVCFEIPFNRSKNSINPTVKTPEECHREINDFFTTFTGEELLFLRNVNRIIIKYQDRQYCFYKQYDETTHVATIGEENLKTKKKQEKQWLIFYQSLATEQESKRDLYTSFAFALDKNNKIESIEGGLFVYFPAEKESTNLNFHIHAPFMPTVARDSVPYHKDGNIEIRDSLVSHFKTVIMQLHTLGYLEKIAQFGILPHANKDRHDFYEPLVNAVTETIQDNPIIPRENNSYVSCDDALWIEDRGFKKLFSSQEARTFVFGSAKSYCQSPQSGSDAYHVLNSVLERINAEDDLSKALCEENNFIPVQKPKWLAELYQYLSKNELYYHRQYGEWHGYYILKDKEGNFLAPEIHGGKVSHTLYDTEMDANVLQDCKDVMGDSYLTVLKKFGVTELDENEKLKILLKKHIDYVDKDLSDCYSEYKESERIKVYLKDFKRLYKHFERKNLKNLPLLASDNIFYGADQFYTPCLSHKMEIFELLGYKPLESIYHKNMEKLSIERDIKPIDFKNVSYSNPAFHLEGRETSNVEGRDCKFSVDISPVFKCIESSSDLDKALKLSVSLWKILVEFEKWHSEKITKSFYCPNGSAMTNFADSTVKKQLNRNAWLFDNENNIIRASDICYEDLHPKYDDGRETIAQILDFKPYEAKKAPIAEQPKTKKERQQDVFNNLSDEDQDRALTLLAQEKRKKQQAKKQQCPDNLGKNPLPNNGDKTETNETLSENNKISPSNENDIQDINFQSSQNSGTSTPISRVNHAEQDYQNQSPLSHIQNNPNYLSGTATNNSNSSSGHHTVRSHTRIIPESFPNSPRELPEPQIKPPKQNTALDKNQDKIKHDNNSEMKKITEEQAIEQAIKYYKEKYPDATITDVQRNNKGWDLEIQSSNATFVVEVKGKSRDLNNFHMTANEYKHMEEYKENYKKQYKIFVATPEGYHEFIFLAPDWCDEKGNRLHIQKRQEISADITIKPI